jgi:hypothetical protein
LMGMGGACCAAFKTVDDARAITNRAVTADRKEVVR